MKRIILALTLSLALAGCAHNSDGSVTLLPTVANPISNTRFVSIESTYGIAMTGVRAYIQNYRDGHRCTKTNLESISNICSRRSVVLAMQDANRKADIALGKAKDFIQRNPTLDATSVLDAAESAVGVLQAISQNKGS